MSDNMQNDEKDKKGGINDPVLEMPKGELFRCPNCKQKVEPTGGMCPLCRHYMGENKVEYQPLSQKTVKKVRMILTFVFLGVFIALAAFGVVKIQSCQG